MKYLLLILIFIFGFCKIQCQSQTKNTFIFGHSLLDHRPPINPTTPDETTVPHWLHHLSLAGNHTFKATGKYGFLPQHAMLPPFAQWGYQDVPAVWDSDIEPFSAADFNTILITAGNFIQYQGPDEEYYNSNGLTPINTTLDIVDWLELQEDDVDIYIYENWPDMAGFIANESFPPTSIELANYHNYLSNDFHEWWIEYQDSLIAARPNANVKMIPVGPIIKELLTDPNLDLDLIPITDLYEDNAPHGRPNIYFLASLITYMSIYQEPAPLNFTIPSSIDLRIRNVYTTIVSNIWTSLQNFNDDNGDSRVFLVNNMAPDIDQDGVADTLDNCITIYNPDQADQNDNGIGDLCDQAEVGAKLEGGALYISNSEGILLKGRDGNCYLIYINASGALVHERRMCPQ